jgi:hypothetical protein
MIFNPYNPPYYNDIFTAYGFVKHRDHYASASASPIFPPAITGA